MQLDTISSLSLGYPFRGKIQESPGTGVVVVQMKNVRLEEGIDWRSCVETQLQGRAKTDWLQPGDILFAARGNHNYAVVIDQAIKDRQAVASPHFYVLRCDSARIVPQYLAWLLNYGPCQRYFERESEGSLTKSIRRDVLAHTQIALPSLQQQRTIVKLADNHHHQQQLLEAKIQNNQKLMAGIANQLFNGQPVKDQQGGSRG